ncbi:MAG: NAD(P)-dependent glycerol-3-phosphate dehydrogenase [Chitinivibrionales bacterium]|nr:NAD(P)-dependent glycerol-3-phosphate dehydrogenase [Chitinivibrionales bacterium]
MNIAILGAGSWAIALSVLLRSRGHNLSLWEFNPADAEALKNTRELPAKLPGIKVPDEVLITPSIATALEGKEYVIVAVPSQTTRATLKSLVGAVPQAAIDGIQGWIVVSKGIECDTLSLMTDVLMQEIPGLSSNKIVVISGPSHAEEVSRNLPTAVVAASTNQHLARLAQHEFSTKTFRIYTNTDVRGVELAASVKNVIAIAAGICDGLGFGDNSKGAILTRGMVEMVRLGRKMGAKEQTFNGLAGIGDLITTAISKHSRNRRMGELIASGLTLSQALKRMTMVAEGVETTKSVYQLAQKYDIEMPITQEVYKTLFEGKSALNAVADLMMRERKPERLDQ